MKVVPLAVRLPLTEVAEEANVTWSPLEKVTLPASLSVDTTVTGTFGPTAIVPPAATVKPLGNS